MKFKRYAVTVLDGWTPWREFFTYWGARKFWFKHERCSHLFIHRGSLMVGKHRTSDWKEIP